MRKCKKQASWYFRLDIHACRHFLKQPVQSYYFNKYTFCHSLSNPPDKSVLASTIGCQYAHAKNSTLQYYKKINMLITEECTGRKEKGSMYAQAKKMESHVLQENRSD